MAHPGSDGVRHSCQAMRMSDVPFIVWGSLSALLGSKGVRGSSYGLWESKSPVWILEC